LVVIFLAFLFLFVFVLFEMSTENEVCVPWAAASFVCSRFEYFEYFEYFVTVLSSISS